MNYTIHHLPCKSSDHLIRSRQRAESTHESHQAQKTYYERSTLQAQFASGVELSMRRRAVPRRVTAWRQADAIVTEQRRQRLRELLDQDTVQWRIQLLNMDVTPNSRVEEMRLRVAELKHKREQERLRVVQEKLQEQRRINCDELRAVKSRAMTQAVTQARAIQITDQQIRNQQEQLENIEYDKAWEQLRQEKVARDEGDRMRRKKANEEQTRILSIQVNELQQARKREQEAELAYQLAVKQETEMIQLKEEYRKVQQLQQARETRLLLEAQNRTQRELKQKQLQQSLQEDIKWIEKLIQIDQQDKEIQHNMKLALRQELLQYRDTVTEQRNKLREQEQEINRIYNLDNERMWNKRIMQWNNEQKKRHNLMQEVIKSRSEQIKLKLEQTQEMVVNKRKERELLQRYVNETQQFIKQQQEQNKIKRNKYNTDLREQIHDKQIRLNQLQQLQNLYDNKQLIADQEYQVWLKRELELARNEIVMDNNITK